MLRNIVFLGLMGLAGGAYAADSGTSYMSTREISAGSRADQVGVGLQAGSLSGVNVELWTPQNNTVSAGLTFASANTALGVTHNWMFQDSFRGDARSLVPYVGAGALGVWGNTTNSDNRNYNNDNFIFAAQVPLGLEFLPQAQRFSVFGELVPCVEVSPYLIGFLNADVGARFYF